MNIDRRFVFVLCILLSACAGQNTPNISALEENTTTGASSAPPTAQALPLFYNTPQAKYDNKETIPLTVALPTPQATLVSSTGVDPSTTTNLFPITAGQGSTPTNNTNPDKFQNFQIPVKSGGGGFGLAGLIPVTGFPPGVITGVKINISSYYNSNSPMLVIPLLDVNTPILGIDLKDGIWDISWLWDQVGWLEGTAYPTRNGNSVLTAHVVTADGKDGPFANLKTLTVDDYVFIKISGYRYIYKVESIDYVNPNDMSVFSHEDSSWLTLITCDSYDEKTGIYLLRVIVRAQLVDIQEIR
jgi:LPXTG-site transpeptidase (sortase) family protein